MWICPHDLPRDLPRDLDLEFCVSVCPRDLDRARDRVLALELGRRLAVGKAGVRECECLSVCPSVYLSVCLSKAVCHVYVGGWGRLLD